VPVVLVPTTLLGMVDAAVGGKTAIDIAAGKNLVGAFHPPAGVLADLSTLETLPAADYAAGLAEVIKAGFIADGEILRLVTADPAGAARPDGPHTRALVARSVAVKARVVAADLRESGLREMLNYGHTLGHAIEKRERYAFRHGDGVAIGMVFAAEVARLSGRLTEPDVARHRDLLAAVGLPVTYRRDAWPDLRATMSLDKKARGARLRMVVLDGVGNPVISDSPPEDLLARAYEAVAA
jgi:3-dehydroquinate synthase